MFTIRLGGGSSEGEQSFTSSEGITYTETKRRHNYLLVDLDFGGPTRSNHAVLQGFFEGAPTSAPVVYLCREARMYKSGGLLLVSGYHLGGRRRVASLLQKLREQTLCFGRRNVDTHDLFDHSGRELSDASDRALGKRG